MVQLAKTAKPKILGISEDKMGMSVQVEGLANAVATVAGGIAHHSSLPPLPLHQRAPLLRRWMQQPKALIAEHSDATMIVGCGNAVAPLVQAFGAATGAFTVWIQRPPPDVKKFDSVVVPQHDQMVGDDVLSTIGAVNALLPEELADREKVAPHTLRKLAHPRLLLLIGGSNRAYAMNAAVCEALVGECVRAVRRIGGSLMITSSRRTDPQSSAYLRGIQAPDIYQWHQGDSGDNPYLDFLALADVAAVTVDSVNMISEASTAQLPVLLLPLPTVRGKRGASAHRRIAAFHQNMQERDLARPWLGWMERWDVPGLNETKRAAEWVWRRYLGSPKRSD